MSLPGYTQLEIRVALLEFWPTREVDTNGNAIRLRDLQCVKIINKLFVGGWWSFDDETVMTCIILDDGSVVQAEDGE